MANPLLYSHDAGNGAARTMSSETTEIIQFEPLIAPMTDKKALASNISGKESKPTYTLRLSSGGGKDETLVFGVDDVFDHGKRNLRRRLNGPGRYTSADYFYILYTLFLHAFAGHRGNSEPIRPTGVISLPISEYNNNETVNTIRETLISKHNLIDNDGCELRLVIESKRLLILPESAGALYDYAFDPVSLKPRESRSTTGTTLVVDIGYETTDVSLFEGLKYQRDASFTIERAGMGIIARAVETYAKDVLKGVDVSRIDRALQTVAGVAPGAKKVIEPIPGVTIDITDVYDTNVAALATRIAQDVDTNYAGAATRALLAGGGVYHLARPLSDNLSIKTELSDNPDTANIRGAFTMLRIQANR